MDDKADSGRLPNVMSRRAKLATSAVIWFCTFTLGLSISFLGASLLELSHRFETSIATISKVFTVITFSYLFGAILCGIMFNYLNRQLVASLLIIIMGIGTIMLPNALSLVLFFCLAALVGFCAAGYNTAQIVWIIEMWEQNSGPYIQTQHFSFALGTFLSPLIIKPFLSSTDDQNPETESIDLDSTYLKSVISNETLEYLHIDGNNSSVMASSNVETDKLYIAFLIGGLTSIFGAVMLLVLYFVNKYEKPVAKVKNVTINSTGWNLRKIAIIVLTSLVIGAYQGMEVCTIQFLPTFTHFIDLKLSKQDGALVLSGLTGAFTIGRAIGIVVVLKVKAEILLLCNIILIIIGTTLALLFASNSLSILWLASVTLGIGFSTVFPSMYCFLEKHLVVTNVVGAVMVVMEGLVSSVYPIIIGTFIEQNPFVLMYTNYFSITVCTTTFVGIYCITRSNRGAVQLDIEREMEVKNDGECGAGVPLKTVEG